MVTNHFPIFVLPFYHLNSEPFWKLIPNIGYEKWIEQKVAIKTFQNLNSAVKFAIIEDELSEFLLNYESREILKQAILDKYFPETKSNFQNTENQIENNLFLYENSEEYKRKIIELKEKIDENSFQEEIFIRGGIFKREIPKIYNNTCAI